MRYPFVCDSCIHLVPPGDDAEVSDLVGSCPAFPAGIPILPEEMHQTVLPGQQGDTVYEFDPQQQEARDIYLAMREQMLNR